ncbi:hypothetical protein [Methylobacterium sp. NEAU K]|uniref:hypothetical protein n=1 Tax=Methylobacterium sp. NEAU K TaxID=3064946 RepID=UPI002735E924|nr:hypothetical protein [Methylobacterium sp. NEAU K]MDP4006519.1 hypothetical protein [Methylobacterium sp. NEAU K]
MTAALTTTTRAGDGAPLTLAFEAAAEAAEIARTYSETAAAFAMIGDRRGLAYALRCASAALLTASQAVETMRPADGASR